MPQTHYSTCTLCEAMCGIEVTTDGDAILSIRGDKQNPFSQGYICPKAATLKDYYDDPERIRQPLKKANGQWVPVSWEHAIDTVANRITDIQSEFGLNAVGLYLGNPNAHNLGALLYGPLFYRALRTRNRFSATSVDQLPHHIVSRQLFGHQMQIPIPDIDRTDFFLILGGNPLASNGSIMSAPNIKQRLKAIQARGGKVVVVDPKKTATASLSDHHYYIRPGSDALLLLGLLHTIFDLNLQKPGKLSELAPELPVLAQWVDDYPPHKVAGYVGMTPEQIIHLAKMFATAKTAVCYGRMGASVQQFGTLSQYLITLLNIITGNLDAPGGAMFTQPAADTRNQKSRGGFGNHCSRVRKLPSFGGELPVACLAEEIMTPGEGQIKAMIIGAGNPVLSTPNGRQLDEAFSSLAFMVSVDFYINESNRHADIILPPVTALQRDHYDIVFHKLAVRNCASFSPPAIAPRDDELSDWQIYLRLAEKFDSHYGAPTAHYASLHAQQPRGVVDTLLKEGRYSESHKLSIDTLLNHPHGVDLGPLQTALPEALFTEDKRIHLCFDFFMADLTRLNAHFFASPAAKHVVLIGRRHIKSNNSWLHNNPRMLKGSNRCTAQLHSSTAASHNITDGQRIGVKSRVGNIEIDAEVTDDIMPNVVSIPHGWGHTHQEISSTVAIAHPGVSCNDLTDASVVDELSGNAVLNGVPVEIYPITA
ncbi:molybdopterin oxidoreductase family protein [Alteromonas sediminis]|uniref:Molybdopterin oxidoreductase family protein n=2 Tax=Alteromonas sediminis TaxID=2259342 RepID=A0A3N5Y511_9ALTE|nr:molybdopterin-dependent oxidoreductase [Alteromonas sediminis]RPJ68046.1 molybdopterin oxidoreductase family protein [Alteromonas sediminis]